LSSFIPIILTSPKEKPEDQKLDLTLRPKSFNDFIGQDKIKNNLLILLEAAKRRQEPPEHLLFYGSAGLGKTTLAYLIAEYLDAKIRITAGPSIERAGDLAAILTSLQAGEILFIDECHRLNKVIEEILYPAMEDYKLDIIIGKGPGARIMRLDLAPFTLVGATTRIGLISSPLRSRFGATYHLDFYNDQDIQTIIKRSAQILNTQITEQGCQTIAKCSRHTPRVANRLLKRVRDYAQVKADGQITPTLAKTALTMLEIDHLGLEPIDRKILHALITKFKGGPAGIQALSAITNEEPDTIEDVHEPYLLQLGFIQRTPQGRVATHLAYKHLGIDYHEGLGQRGLV